MTSNDQTAIAEPLSTYQGFNGFPTEKIAVLLFEYQEEGRTLYSTIYEPLLEIGFNPEESVCYTPDQALRAFTLYFEECLPAAYNFEEGEDEEDIACLFTNLSSESFPFYRAEAESFLASLNEPDPSESTKSHSYRSLGWVEIEVRVFDPETDETIERQYKETIDYLNSFLVGFSDCGFTAEEVAFNRNMSQFVDLIQMLRFAHSRMEMYGAERAAKALQSWMRGTLKRLKGSTPEQRKAFCTAFESKSFARTIKGLGASLPKVGD